MDEVVVQKINKSPTPPLWSTDLKKPYQRLFPLGQLLTLYIQSTEPDWWPKCVCVRLFMRWIWVQELRSHRWSVSLFLSGLCYAKLSACPTSLTYLLGRDFNSTALSFSFSLNWLEADIDFLANRLLCLTFNLKESFDLSIKLVFGVCNN